MKPTITPDAKTLAAFRLAIETHPDFGKIFIEIKNGKRISADTYEPLPHYTSRIGTPIGKPSNPNSAQNVNVSAAPTRIDEIQHRNRTYITVDKARLLADQESAKHKSAFPTGNIFANMSTRYEQIRRIDLGPEGTSIVALYDLEDVLAAIRTRITTGAFRSLPKHENVTERLVRFFHDGNEWMKTTEAYAILGNTTVKSIIEHFHTHTPGAPFDRALVNPLYRQIEKRKIPTLSIGNMRGSYLRTRDFEIFQRINSQ
jgi:hypothetical protein